MKGFDTELNYFVWEDLLKFIKNKKLNQLSEENLQLGKFTNNFGF